MSSSRDRPHDAGMQQAPLREEQPLSGITAYEAAIDRLIDLALGRIRIFDRSLGRSFNTSARTEALHRFLRANEANRIEIVVHDAGNIRLDCPRLVNLQRHFAHALSIHHTLSAARGVYDPFCLIDGSHYARRFHFDSLRGVLVLNDAAGSGVLLQRFAEILEASQPAVTATTLGL